MRKLGWIAGLAVCVSLNASAQQCLVTFFEEFLINILDQIRQDGVFGFKI